MVVHIVEDDPGVSDALLLVLSGLGHEVLCYPDAESFMREARFTARDTIIIDLMLPGLSGGELARWIKARPEAPRVIVISGQPQARIRAELDGLSIDRLVRKPLSGEAIAAAL